MTTDLHNAALEIGTLVEDVTRLLKRSGLHNHLSPIEMTGYTRRMDRLREISSQLALGVSIAGSELC